MFDFEKLEVYLKAKAFNNQVFDYITVNKNFDRVTRDQLRRASFSIMLNIAAKNEQRNPFHHQPSQHKLRQPAAVERWTAKVTPKAQQCWQGEDADHRQQPRHHDTCGFRIAQQDRFKIGKPECRARPMERVSEKREHCGQ